MATPQPVRNIVFDIGWVLVRLNYRPLLEFLQAHGCDEAQGFLFSKPLTPEECAALLGSQATRQRARIA